MDAGQEICGGSVGLVGLPPHAAIAAALRIVSHSRGRDRSRKLNYQAYHEIRLAAKHVGCVRGQPVVDARYGKRTPGIEYVNTPESPAGNRTRTTFVRSRRDVTVVSPRALAAERKKPISSPGTG